MIYQIQTTNLYGFNNESHYGGRTSNKLLDAVNGDLSSLNEYAIHIPKAYSRNEDDTVVKDVSSVDSYVLYIEEQIGTIRNRRDTYVYLELPKSKSIVPIILYMDGGVGFDSKFHKNIIREIDELGRRIILGFCLKYESSLRAASYEKIDNDIKRSRWYKTIQLNASRYRESDMPKRLKPGSRGNDFTHLYNDLEPYEESNLFSSIHFI